MSNKSKLFDVFISSLYLKITKAPQKDILRRVEKEVALAAMRIALCLLALLFLLPPMHAQAGYNIYGKVIGVKNGDTLTVLTPLRATLLVRLSEIDAPELGQPYGDTAKNFLMAIALDKDVKIVSEARDRDNKTIARVYINGRDVNLQLVQNGTAWAYRAFLRDETLLRAEETARKQRVGLWSLPASQRIPPWEWRKGAQLPAEKIAPVKP